MPFTPRFKGQKTGICDQCSAERRRVASLHQTCRPKMTNKERKQRLRLTEERGVKGETLEDISQRIDMLPMTAMPILYGLLTQQDMVELERRRSKFHERMSGPDKEAVGK